MDLTVFVIMCENF